jgi:hypothetical protein
MANGQRPTILQFFPCELAVFDLAINSWVLTRPLFETRLPPGATFPFRLIDLALYVQMTDGIGTFNMQVELRVPITQARVFRTPPHPITFPANRMAVIEEVFNLQNVPIRTTGEFEFRLVANSLELPATARLIVR